MNPKQIKISIGMTLGALFAIGVLLGGATQIEIGDPPDRLGFVAQWLLLPGLVLFACVLKIAKDRFYSDALIDGQKPEPGSTTDIDCRVLQNTLEQVVLAAIGWTALAIHLQAEHLGVIPALAVAFVFARLCFWIGYHKSGPARSFGFAATFYTMFGVYAWALYLWIW